MYKHQITTCTCRPYMYNIKKNSNNYLWKDNSKPSFWNLNFYGTQEPEMVTHCVWKWSYHKVPHPSGQTDPGASGQPPGPPQSPAALGLSQSSWDCHLNANVSVHLIDGQDNVVNTFIFYLYLDCNIELWTLIFSDFLNMVHVYDIV